MTGGRGKNSRPRAGRSPPFRTRSEEHTSELQSQSNLVCRLLLEKKKQKHTNLSQHYAPPPPPSAPPQANRQPQTHSHLHKAPLTHNRFSSLRQISHTRLSHSAL